MAGGRVPGSAVPPRATRPQWSPGLMAGGRPAPRLVSHGAANSPQWSPGLMAGGSGRSDAEIEHEVIAAMEPRPDGRGK